MKVRNIPFSLVFLSSLLPIAGALFNLPVYHIAAGFLLASLFLTSIHSRLRNFFTLNDIWLARAFFLLIFLLVVQVLTGRGFVILAAGGYVLAFAFIFLGRFWSGAGVSAVGIVRGVGLLYKYFIMGLIIEAIIVFFGWQPQLGQLLASVNSPNYKYSNSADVLRFFGLMHNAGGLNSVLLGSQIAGMLSLFSTIWFMGVSKIEIHGLKEKHPNFWAFLSFLLLLLTINGTVLLLLVMALFVYVLLIVRVNKITVFGVASSLFLVLYFLVSRGHILQRILNDRLVNLQPAAIERLSVYGLENLVAGMTTFEYYIFEFLTPIYLFISLPSWVDILFGVGAQYLKTTSNYLSGDFGFGAVLLSSGLVWMAGLAISLLVICFPGIRPAKGGSKEQKIWSCLRSLNGLITLLFLFSTVHYNQAFSNPGAMMLFSLHLALTSYCRKCFLKSPYSAISPTVNPSFTTTDLR